MKMHGNGLAINAHNVCTGDVKIRKNEDAIDLEGGKVMVESLVVGW